MRKIVKGDILRIQHLKLEIHFIYELAVKSQEQRVERAKVLFSMGSTEG